MNQPRVFVTGSTGFLGEHLVAHLRAHTPWPVCDSGRQSKCTFPADLEAPATLCAAVHRAQPTRIVHLGALASVAECEACPELARRVNTESTATLCDYARINGIPLLLASTDQVFDGRLAPYSENAHACPLSVYGVTKRDAERLVLDLPGNLGTIFRISLAYGFSRSGRGSALEMILRASAAGETVSLFHDEWRTPVWVDDLVTAMVSWIGAPAPGIFHAGGRESLSRFDFGRRVVESFGLDPIHLIRAGSRLNMPPPERPRDLSLLSERLFRVYGWSATTTDVALSRLALKWREKTGVVPQKFTE